MTIHILDDADEGLRERLVKRLMEMRFSEAQARGAVTALLATIPAVDDAAVGRAADAAFDVIEKAQTQLYGSQWNSLSDAEDAVRAAIAALGKGDK